MPAIASPPLVLTRLDRDAVAAPERAAALEWIEADGLGGYAASTVLACPTRRYHGLLVARPPGNPRRHVFLSRFEETLEDAQRSFPLSMARYAGLFSPEGFRHLESFEARPHPSFRYRCGPAEVRREVMAVRGRPAVLCRYRVSGAEPGAALVLRPLLPFREADLLTEENGALDPRAAPLPAGIRCRPYESLPAIDLVLDGAPWQFLPAPVWYRGIQFPADQERGYHGREDEFSPGVLRIAVAGEADFVVAATIGAPVEDPSALWRRESEGRRRRAAAVLAARPAADGRVALAADDFLFRAPDGRLGVVAGYPWFGEWGRDTFVALPGLTLARGELAACGEVLAGTLPFLKDGLLPNVYGTSPADSHYGSVDASLWFAWAARHYQRAGAPRARVLDELRPALTEIARAYHDGTGLGIAADAGGLIAAGGPGLNGTWMDARTASGPVTPRDGCAVEINALWYSLLQHVEMLALAAGDRRSAREWQARRLRARRSFLERFWLENGSYLADRWRDGSADRAVRPNMVIAAALEQSPLTRAQRAGVVALARAELLTPRGLRTLSPRDPAYVPRYRGGPRERDEAYHQGTVWPWLLGFYVEASLRAHGTRKAHRAELSALWDALVPELDRAGLGHFSEVFDGDPPHSAGGTFAQAWNTAEYLRSRALLARGRNP
ncbi:MAG: amylo-alpha-1,6-glucosidase [Planctomycetota bacterium]